MGHQSGFLGRVTVKLHRWMLKGHLQTLLMVASSLVDRVDFGKLCKMI